MAKRGKKAKKSAKRSRGRVRTSLAGSCKARPHGYVAFVKRGKVLARPMKWNKKAKGTKQLGTVTPFVKGNFYYVKGTKVYTFKPRPRGRGK